MAVPQSGTTFGGSTFKWYRKRDFGMMMEIFAEILGRQMLLTLLMYLWNCL